MPLFYNKKGGGAHGSPSEETKRKISESEKGKVLSEESRKKISEAEKGRRLGPLSLETRKKISEAQTGKKRGPHSEETRRKISEAHTGSTNIQQNKVCSGQRRKTAGNKEKQ